MGLVRVQPHFADWWPTKGFVYLVIQGVTKFSIQSVSVSVRLNIHKNALVEDQTCGLSAPKGALQSKGQCALLILKINYQSVHKFVDRVILRYILPSSTEYFYQSVFKCVVRTAWHARHFEDSNMKSNKPLRIMMLTAVAAFVLSACGEQTAQQGQHQVRLWWMSPKYCMSEWPNGTSLPAVYRRQKVSPYPACIWIYRLSEF